MIFHLTRDVTDSASESESDGIRHFFRNPKSVGYLKSDRVGFEIFVSVQQLLQQK